MHPSCSAPGTLNKRERQGTLFWGERGTAAAAAGWVEEGGEAAYARPTSFSLTSHSF